VQTFVCVVYFFVFLSVASLVLLVGLSIIFPVNLPPPSHCDTEGPTQLFTDHVIVEYYGRRTVCLEEISAPPPLEKGAHERSNLYVCNKKQKFGLKILFSLIFVNVLFLLIFGRGMCE